MSLDAEKIEDRRIWHRFSRWLGRDDSSPCPDPSTPDPEMGKPSLGRRLSRKVVPGLPRPATFRRQNSEKRERLTPVDQACAERRTLSVDRRRAKSARPASPPPVAPPKLSAPAVCDNETEASPALSPEDSHNDSTVPSMTNAGSQPPDQQVARPAPPPSPPPDDPLPRPDDHPLEDDMDDEIRQELEERWILNLSMHFRDRSPREKFFVTYAETKTKWRRVSISCDYRDAPPDSLERDLQSLQYQRDKSARIYEAIRSSLPNIQFYDTVTNLRLETSHDDRLHVHVTEDVNEIIPYPSLHAVQHINFTRIPESEVHFESHMSGFVYKVRVNDRICVKKEIPGPDSVEEFLYEINALYSLMGSQNVIQFQGLVIDEELGLVKGLLIDYAEHGPLVDVIFDFKGTSTLTWERREKWARQIVQGLSEIHEAGFVQGDFTLSNIVIDENDSAKIIDINRRGCPVGWEPPEMAKMIESGQRISMYIGVKSDLFQLGMVLWALAEEEDEPERQSGPLIFGNRSSAPEHLREITSVCLSPYPRDRLAAKDLLACFPRPVAEHPPTPTRSLMAAVEHRGHVGSSEPQYIDPDAAVEREDIARHSGHRHADSQQFSDPHTYVDRRSSIDIPFDGPGSYIISRRGRAPPTNTMHLQELPRRSIGENPAPSAAASDCEPQIVPVSPSGEHTWEQINIDGHEYLFQRETVDSNEDPDEPARRVERRTERLSGEELVRAMEHVDSGLADMDLVGVGENENLQGYSGRRGEDMIEEDLDDGNVQHSHLREEISQGTA